MVTTVEGNQQKSHKNSWVSQIALGTFLLLILLNLPALCQAHDNGETPSFKYSKEANKMYVEKQDSMHHHEHEHKHENEEHHHHHKPVLSEISYIGMFLKAAISTIFISIAPFCLLFLINIDNTKESEAWRKILLSFGAGGLLGDAFLHLIPHALVPCEHSHVHSEIHDDHSDHKHMSVGLCVLLGIIVFLIVQKVVKMIRTDHSHTHVHTITTENVSKGNNSDKKLQKSSDTSDVTSKEKKDKEHSQNEMKDSSYLNIVADFLHNFTDGLAIGASYLAGQNIGYITTFTILLHEIPHEIGDFAILIQNGCSKEKAMQLQLVTAVGAVIGTIISFCVEGIGHLATMWILPFTAGGFIYIATVSVIPELLTDTNFKQSVKEVGALLAGVSLMIVIAKYE